MDTKDQANGSESEIDDIEQLIAEREKLDTLFKEKFSKVVTVMFTDLKGSTSIAEAEGDFATRAFIKKHNEIIIPAIENNNGNLVKTMGDGSLSYFPKAQDAARAAASIQSQADEYNLSANPKTPLLIRVGMHTGTTIIEENDIFGDVVNTASRFESSANPGEIYMSEDTYNALEDKGEYYCRFIKTTKLKGKKEEYKVYKLFWNPEEVEDNKFATEPGAAAVETAGFPYRWVIGLVSVCLLIFLVYLSKQGAFHKKTEKKRSIHHSVVLKKTSSSTEEPPTP